MDYSVTRADNGRLLTLQVADRLLIQLDENSTTGFRWAIDTIDDHILGMESATYVPLGAGAIGGGGTRHFTFVAKQSGVMPVRFKLWREWLGDASVTQRYELTVRVL